MKKVVFTNKLFRSLLIGFIIILSLFNIYAVLKTGSAYGIASIIIEIVLLILILSKNQYTKISILIWAIVALIIGFGFEMVAELLDGLNNDFKTFKIDSFIYNTIGLVIGILIIDYTRRTVVVTLVDGNLNDKA